MVRVDGGPGTGVPVLVPRTVVEARAPSPAVSAVSVSSSAEPAAPPSEAALPPAPVAKATPEQPPVASEG
eukprot:5070050-Alexandrium_andersonii.AAC.1